MKRLFIATREATIDFFVKEFISRLQKSEEANNAELYNIYITRLSQQLNEPNKEIIKKEFDAILKTNMN